MNNRVQTIEATIKKEGKKRRGSKKKEKEGGQRKKKGVRRAILELAERTWIALAPRGAFRGTWDGRKPIFERVEHAA